MLNYRKYFAIFLLISFELLGACCVQAKVSLGIDVLEQSGYSVLRGKRVGFLTHSAGVNGQGVSSLEVVLKGKNNVVAIFAPEHGLDGSKKAFEHVDHTVYAGTKIPVYSLHGDHRKPTKQMLKNMDVLLVDLQDIGVRSYTYNSCLKLCMEACFEAGIEVIILDRPNPFGGLKVDGPVLDKSLISYVGPYPIPYMYGLTMGELALMAKNEPGWLNIDPAVAKNGRLKVISMKGWNRKMLWVNTGLNWKMTSPNIPSVGAALGYAMTGLGCQLGYMKHGLKTAFPFRLLHSEKITAGMILKKLREKNIPGLYIKKKITDDNTRRSLVGAYIEVKDWEALRPTRLNFHIMKMMCEFKMPNPFAKATVVQKQSFNKHTGSLELWNALVKDGAAIDLDYFFNKWDKQCKEFQERSQRYYLYD